MKTYGIIAEYNPFHNGHYYHIEETRKRTGCDAVVALMSGDFVQRGEPALLDKWTRAEAAVRGGADLVLELPAVFACSSAEGFAGAGVGILNGLGVVDGLSFGVEADPAEGLVTLAEWLAEETPAYQEELKKGLSEGLSYARARSEAVRRLAGNAAEREISQPNNILAVEYLKQMKRLNSPLKPVMITRKDSGYHSVDILEEMAGAGWIRDRIRSGIRLRELCAYYPEDLKEIYSRKEEADPEDLFPLLLYALRTRKDLADIDGVTEGLENRAARAALQAENLEDLLGLIKSKRYSLTAVRRMLIRILLGITKDDMTEMQNAGQYAVRVLGFNARGASLIREITRLDGPVKLITNVNRQRPEEKALKMMMAYDSIASDLYDLMRNGRFGELSEYKMNPYREE